MNSKLTNFAQERINDSFGNFADNQPHSTKNKQLKYKVAYLGKSHWQDESLDSEEEEEESEVEQEVIDSKGISVDQTSDDDEVVDSVVNRLKSFGHPKQHKNKRYEHSMSDFEFTHENIFRQSKDTFIVDDSKESAFSHLGAENHQQSGFNLPLQMLKQSENTPHNITFKKPDVKDKSQIELAVWLYDFKPQKKTDLGFKAGERISRS